VKTSELLLWGTAGFVGYSLWNKRHAAQTLNFFPDEVKDFHFSGLTPVFTLGLGVQNTSNQSFTINALVGNAMSNGFYVGNLANFKPQVVPKISQGILLVECRMSLIGVVNDLISAFQNHDFTQNLIIQGTANVDNLQVPLDLKFKVGL
jgi:hypothetical protein